MRARQNGVAIVLAMGVVALAAITATAMMVTQSSWLRQNELTADHVQAQTLIQVGVDWTRALLRDDRRASNIDYLGEPWALRLPPIPVENGSLSGLIEDQQGRFNLNNLVKDGKVNLAQRAHFQRLLSILGLPPELADAVADWVDADSEPQPEGGAEDEYYLALPSPYLAANRPLIDVAELVLVRGFDESVRARLRPYVSALPVFTAVNVNTASPEVIAAVVDDLSLDGARALVEKRDRAYFRDRTDFPDQLPRDVKVANEDIAFSSNYFMVQLRVTIGSAQARSIALLARTDANWPTIVWRKML
ncbi:type II secretion system minor pseudopilin GspK [Sulfuricella sp.]|uniref:type II secretion system minor pseudopilin GspK n=1 Tax=Sulfuricella sp. TaxID=2099377 RepID=UPI002B8952DC|nr:type II secretion system minor pseudopilin GspK [Sulfuricella sp.]HUX65131.1 type II secretion system minor pseudopilin GspK [Sulfuricella sp.]